MASSKPHRAFDRLPFEIVEAFLELQDIRNLRLVSQTVTVKSGPRTFEKYFANKTVNWKSTTELRSLVQMTQPQHMGCFLKSLTIKGHAPTASREYSTEIVLLTEALTNLRHNSVKEGRALPETFPHWRSLSQSASETLEITSQALAESDVSVQKLDIFGSIKRCSPACNKIAPLLERVELSKTPISLRYLSLSLSHHLGEVVKNDETPEIDRAVGQGYVNDIKRLLELCPHLESLELHWYNLRRHELSGAQMEEQGSFSKVAQLDNHFSQLRHCRLDGINTEGTALLAFSKQTTQLTSLTKKQNLL